MRELSMQSVQERKENSNRVHGDLRKPAKGNHRPIVRLQEAQEGPRGTEGSTQFLSHAGSEEMKKGERSAINCISGGVDSVTTAYYVKKTLKPKDQLLIFCDYKQRTYAYEEFCIKKVARHLDLPLKIIDIRWLGDISTSVLTHPEKEISETKEADLWDPEKARQRILRWWDPCRNAILLLVGLSHAESFYISKAERYDVYIGIRRETPVAMKDNTPEFLEEMNRMAEQATHHGGYRLLAPLLFHHKDKEAGVGGEIGLASRDTHPCYAGIGVQNKAREQHPDYPRTCSNV